MTCCCSCCCSCCCCCVAPCWMALLRHGRGLRVGRRLEGMLLLLRGDWLEVRLRCGLALEKVHWRGRSLLGLGRERWRRRLQLMHVGVLLLQLRQRRLVEGMVLQLRGRRSVLAEAAGLSGTVDLTQRVQRLALGVFQQVGLALRDAQQRDTTRSTLKRCT